MMIEYKNCGPCNCGKMELYKVRDEIWTKVDTNDSNPCACTSCLAIALGRDLLADDFDLNFPWWKTERDDYYAGFRDGLSGYNQPRSGDGQYEFGRQFAHKFYVNPHDPNNYV